MYQTIEKLIRDLEHELNPTNTNNNADFKFALQSTIYWLKLLKKFY